MSSKLILASLGLALALYSTRTLAQLAPLATTQLHDIIAPDAVPKVLVESTNFQFCEGPVWDELHQRLLFSDVAGGKLYSWSENVGLAVVLDQQALPTGNKFLPNGKLLQCSGGQRALVSIDLETGKQEILLDQYNGHHFNSPNDLAIRNDGTIWFSDPDHGLGFTGQQPETDIKGVYRYDPQRQSLELVNATLYQPNGLAFSPQQDILYIGVAPNASQVAAAPNEVERSVWAFDITPGKTLKNPRQIIKLAPTSWGVDGLKTDRQGNLYLSSGEGVRIYQADGTELGLIPTEHEVVTMAFGGPDYQTLFIVCHQAIYAVDLQVAGLMN